MGLEEMVLGCGLLCMWNGKVMVRVVKTVGLRSGMVGEAEG